MDREMVVAIETVCNEKNVNSDDVFEAIELALASVERRKYKEKHNEELDVRVEFDREKSTYHSFRRWLVMEDDDPEFESPDYHVLLTNAKLKNPDIQTGEYIEEPMDSASLGRISAHIAKQVLVKKIREAERKSIIDEYSPKIGTLVMGSVKREDYTGVFVDIDNKAVGFIPREKMIMREAVRPGDRIRVHVVGVLEDSREAHFLLSRTSPELLKALFRLEVPEINQGVIEIISVARDPGLRAKIAVRSNDPKLDPLGACVGMRGSRVQAVSNELAGERIDIIKWDEDPAKFVVNAMSLTPITSINIDEETKSIVIVVPEEKLSLAIGRGGQNIKLASRLTGWDLKVMSEQQAEETHESEQQQLHALFKEKLDVDDELAMILAQEGFADISEIAEVDESEMLEIEEIDKEMVVELRKRAKDAMIKMTLAGEVPSEGLLALKGMDVNLGYRLAKAGVVEVKDLAEYAVDELVEKVEMDKERAAALIMAARKAHFAESEEQAEQSG